MPYRSHNYRADIDGLRGLAVLFVLAFHASPTYLPGGFIGVDVFFVISGYLISSIIFSEIRNQSFSITRFYQRRIRRIFPALITVLFGTLLLGWWLLLDREYRNLGHHVIGGATFIANFLIYQEIGYFGFGAELQPLLHLWSLGIEEQFYILFPLCVALVIRLRPAITLLFLISGFLISFEVCLYGIVADPVGTFYLPFSRLWELILGCILAALRREYRESLCGFSQGANLARLVRCFSNLRTSASLCALLMISGSALLFSSSRLHPNVEALIPTMGTGLIIAVGENSWVNRSILGNRVLVGVGLVSYPLYLWHWPLLVFARLLSEGPVSPFAITAAMGLAFCLALLTFWLIEYPIRYKRVRGAVTGGDHVAQNGRLGNGAVHGW